jgi:hypothetical protein
VICEVEIDFRKGKDAIFFIVFPTRHDALGNLRDGLKAAKGVTSRRPLHNLPQGNVIITTTTTNSAPGSMRGDVAGTLALTRLALRHLRAIERRL